MAVTSLLESAFYEAIWSLNLASLDATAAILKHTWLASPRIQPVVRKQWNEAGANREPLRRIA